LPTQNTQNSTAQPQQQCITTRNEQITMSLPYPFTLPSPHLQPSSEETELGKLLAKANNFPLDYIDINVRNADERIEDAAGEALDLNRRNIFGFDPMRLFQIFMEKVRPIYEPSSIFTKAPSFVTRLIFVSIVFILAG
jgi:hypothetical protein